MSEHLWERQKKVEEAVVGAYQKIEDAVVGAYQRVEETVVSAYQKVEDGAVNGYKRVENAFTGAFLEREVGGERPAGGQAPDLPGSGEQA